MNNPELQRAWQIIENTGTHLFLTGKAGTGKTTFLRNLKKESPKRTVIVAPTGIAAINAGGVTIHSFFQLPFAPFIPDTTFNTEQKHFRFSKEKINIIRSMDLLIIDEISMVRADLLDAIDSVLRRYRDRYKPFGGVQLLMIGDLQQLAPVVKETEWNMLNHYYDTSYFFGSLALKKTTYATIELKQVYRQNDPYFLSLLNKVRENKADEQTLAELNQRYIPNFHPAKEKGYIQLTTHNYQAQQINDHELSLIKEPVFSYKAEVAGIFPEYSYPTDEVLELKRGAQVMFVKNDSSAEKRYYNGKIGRITAISADNILVRCGDEKDAITVTREEWTNTKYSIDAETQEISETVAGSFKQYPLKTAWAITIHKSQGLTFEKAIVNAGAAFTHGQVYVALSRCKSLEGLVLGTPLRPEALINDQVVKHFTDEVSRNQPGPMQLEDARRAYYLQLLKELFDYSGVLKRLQHVAWVFGEHLWKLYPELTKRCREVRELCHSELTEVGEKFQMQLERLIEGAANYDTDRQVGERIAKGVAYFSEQTGRHIVAFLESAQPEIDNKDVRKTVGEALEKLRLEVGVKIETLEAVKEGFEVKAYLMAKAKAVLEKPKPRARKTTEKLEVGEDVLHPKLYNALRLWRKEEAMRLGLPAYTVLQQKALLGVANTLPTTGKELLAIPGIGKKVAERYGAALLEMVDHYRLNI